MNNDSIDKLNRLFKLYKGTVRRQYQKVLIDTLYNLKFQMRHNSDAIKGHFAH